MRERTSLAFSAGPLLLCAMMVHGADEEYSLVISNRGFKDLRDKNSEHMKWLAPWPNFDFGIPTPGNIGGWCETHGNVACIIAEV